MDAEERHELKENDLASWLQYGLPMFLKQNGSYIVLVAALCFLGFQLYRMYEQKQQNTRIQGWSELFSAGTSDNPMAKIQSVIDTYDIPALRAEGYLEMGGIYAMMPMNRQQLATMKITSQEALDQAYNAYKKAFDLAGNDRLLAGKAKLGMAGADEDRGNWEGARKAYEAMADKNGQFKDSPFVDVAADRLSTLGDRERAPRLVSMLPLPRPAMTSPAETLPGGMGSLPGMFPTLPELGGGGGGVPTFAAPTGLDVAPPAVPATAPVEAPATGPK